MRSMVILAGFFSVGCHDWQLASASTTPGTELTCTQVNKREASVQVRSDNQAQVIKNVELYIHQRSKSWYVEMENSANSTDTWTVNYHIKGLKCNRHYTYSVE